MWRSLDNCKIQNWGIKIYFWIVISLFGKLKRMVNTPNMIQYFKYNNLKNKWRMLTGLLRHFRSSLEYPGTFKFQFFSAHYFHALDLLRFYLLHLRHWINTVLLWTLFINIFSHPWLCYHFIHAFHVCLEFAPHKYCQNTP